MPTQLDGQYPQFNEWAGEVKVYLTIHNVHIQDYIDESGRSVETVDILPEIELCLGKLYKAGVRNTFNDQENHETI
eukprot:6491577-Amphidinium_carterae.3